MKLSKFLPSLPEIITAASMAFNGLLGSVTDMILNEVDLSSVPADHMAALISCVKFHVDIMSVNCDLLRILDSVKSKVLSINNQRLNSEKTGALVRAMESRVEEVELGEWGDLSLDITALSQYSGQGMCRKLVCHNEAADNYSWYPRLVF